VITFTMTLLPASGNLLFRQVREKDVKDGILSSLAFRPMPDNDQGELSVDVEHLIIDQQPLHTTARQSYEAFKANGGDTDCVYAVTTKECADLGLAAYHKPKTEPPVNVAHGIVDLTALTTNQQRRKSQRLAELAMKRKCVYPVGWEPDAPPALAPPATGQP
jgi:hypothetical protein